MRHRLTRLAIAASVIAAVATLTATRTSNAQTVSFANIADSTDPRFDSLIAQEMQSDPIALNGAGTVAFRATSGLRLEESYRVQGIYIGRGGGNGAIATIADTSNPEFSVLLAPLIDSAGTVCFTAGRADGGGGIYTGTASLANPSRAAKVTTKTIANTDSLRYSNFTDFAMSRSGIIAFVAERDGGGSALYTVTRGVIKPVVRSADSPFAGFGIPVVNDAGTVAFASAFDEGAGGGIFTVRGRTTRTIAATRLPQRAIHDGFDMNNTGTVVMLGIFPNAVYTGRGGALRTIADSTSPKYQEFRLPVINDAGTVAFSATSRSASGETNRSGIYTVTKKGTRKTLVDSDTSDLVSFGPPMINSAGTVAFLADHLKNGTGLFVVGFGFAAPFKVIGIGSPLFGSTVTGIRLTGKNLLNDRNQIAFRYTLKNEVAGIAVASIRGAHATRPAHKTENIRR